MSRLGDVLQRIFRPRRASADWTNDSEWDRDPTPSHDSGKHGETFGSHDSGKHGESFGSHDANASDSADDGGSDDGGDSDGGGDD